MTSDSFRKPHSDPLGLYRALGLTPTATAEEIAAAFRRRSKETHPDTSGRESAEEFVQVSAAYEVLGDPARREKYDRSSWELFKRDVEAQKACEQDSDILGAWGKTRIDPICCDFCGKVTLQPRYLTFSYFVGLVVWAHGKHASGIFCVRCARLKAILYSLITMVTGWWGLSGPYYTVLTILQNGFETERIKEADYRFILHNAKAFLFSGKLKLAYSLARMSSKSFDISTSRESEIIINQIERSGSHFNSPILKNCWGKSLFWDLSHVVIAFILPVSLGVYLVVCEVAFQKRFEEGQKYPLVAQTAPVACKHPPTNGQALGPPSPLIVGHRLGIRNNSLYDVIIKIRARSTWSAENVVASFFVAKGQEALSPPILEGTYTVQVAAGENFGESCDEFLNYIAINARTDFVTIKSSVPESGIIYDDPVLNIHDVSPYDDYPTRGRSRIYYTVISAEDFNKP